MVDATAAPGGPPLPSNVARPDAALQAAVVHQHVQAISDLMQDLPDMAGMFDALNQPVTQADQPQEALAATIGGAATDGESAADADYSDPYDTDGRSVDLGDYSAVDETLDTAVSQVTAIQQQLHAVLTNSSQAPA